MFCANMRLPLKFISLSRFFKNKIRVGRHLQKYSTYNNLSLEFRATRVPPTAMISVAFRQKKSPIKMKKTLPPQHYRNKQFFF